jgi:hypothetical protein
LTVGVYGRYHDGISMLERIPTRDRCSVSPVVKSPEHRHDTFFRVWMVSDIILDRDAFSSPRQTPTPQHRMTKKSLNNNPATYACVYCLCGVALAYFTNEIPGLITMLTLASDYPSAQSITSNSKMRKPSKPAPHNDYTQTRTTQPHRLLHQCKKRNLVEKKTVI